MTALLLSVLVQTAAPNEISVATLLSEMVNLAALARYPNPPFTERQASSYDRAAKSPTEDWFANGDYGKYLRSEPNGERVMADLKGPGTVVRFWSANPNGDVRFYFDGEATPRIHVPLANLLGGEMKPFPAPFSGMHARGANLYFPFPYAKSLKITVSGQDKVLDGIYYQINYRTYPSATRVRSFTMEGAATAVAKEPGVTEKLSGQRILPPPHGKLISTTIAAGKSAEVFKQSVSGQIHMLQLRLQAPDVPAALRACTLVGVFDGEETIYSPVGDFFGSAPGINPYNSLPMTVESDGTMTCRFAMPFRKSASLSINNNGASPVSVTGVVVCPQDDFPSDGLLFHAKWRMEKTFSRPMRDWNFLTASGGRGVFVGSALHVVNPTTAWWGEGDEKIYVDGETFPSTFGTGTEDYYGYAWCCPDPFQHAYHNQTRCDGPGNKGYTSVNRWQIFDRMPWNNQFRFDMELWHWAEVDVYFAVTAYWYAEPQVTDTFQHASVYDLVVPEVPKPKRVANALEGEELKVTAKTGGETEKQGFEQLSNGEQLWWRDGKPGDTISFTIPVAAAGKYEVVGNFCTAGDYGIIALVLNGSKIAEVDFYSPDLKWQTKSLGTFEFNAGDNVLTAKVVGANDKAIKRYMFGVDYLLLKPVK